jgi:hypothetical protein
MKDTRPGYDQSMKEHSQYIGMPETDEFYTTRMELATKLSTTTTINPSPE